MIRYFLKEISHPFPILGVKFPLYLPYHTKQARNGLKWPFWGVNRSHFEQERGEGWSEHHNILFWGSTNLLLHWKKFHDVGTFSLGPTSAFLEMGGVKNIYPICQYFNFFLNLPIFVSMGTVNSLPQHSTLFQFHYSLRQGFRNQNFQKSKSSHKLEN